MSLSARLRFLLLSSVLVLACLTGCGYQLSSMAPITLPGGHTRLYIAKVTNPTIESWIEPRLRSSLRDEFTRRGSVQWVDRNTAQSLVEVIVHSYSTATSVKGEDEETVRSSATITMEVQIFDSGDHSLLWTSGRVSGQESYTGSSDNSGSSDPNRLEASYTALEEAVRKSADRLSDQF